MSRLDRLRKTMAAATATVNEQVAQRLPLSDPKDFEAAHRGLLAAPQRAVWMALAVQSAKPGTLGIGIFSMILVPQRSIHLCGEWRN